MPRYTCRPSECVANGNGDLANGNHDDTNNCNNNNNNTTAGSHSSAFVKQEFDATPPVCHRKSERRKIARDIFLVFEEQPARRRGRGGARGKCTRAKQKFGHLKVANTPRINKNILREIKTEPKCSTAAADAEVAAAEAHAASIPFAEELPPLQVETPSTETVPERQKETELATELAARPVREPEKPKANMAAVKIETKAAATVAAPTATAVPRKEQPSPAATATAAAAATPTTPSVNPIFLWVKQDDTRIVEVRCEDYDKRNRIRLTKTTNGWRSMPRTDASSSRIVKFFHSSTAPLIKVKREQMQQQDSMEQVEQEQDQEQQVPQLHDWTVVHEQPEQAEQEQPIQAAVIENVVVVPAQEQQQLETTTASADVCFDALLDSETNASTKATKTNTSNANTPTYQSSPSPAASPSPTPTPTPTPSPLELQLCPKTGLFLPKGAAAAAEASLNVEASDNARLAEQEEDVPEQTLKPTITGHSNDHASLDANTKNLKDLLDDADDLLQSCGSDNGSSGAELLDSLVQRSCEDNLMQESRQQQAQATAATASAADELSLFCVPDMAGKELPSILGMDSSDAPKCLSFNEAGEIEGLNGDLFLGIDAFDKQPVTDVDQEEPDHVDTVLPAAVEKEQPQSLTVPDEAPKDLSYKKREEVCPPSESRSQCAVTSSSDILKSKTPDPEQPAPSIPAEVETTSETIKHLILEQFLKLNGNVQQQAEPMDLGKAASGRSGGDKLHTVVIDDEDGDDEEAGEAEPVKKRPKAIKMDKDPDALTQLKMLISNPQWKVPDPILVPKDRLGAVLASPAREIPLLLTTRPELRLPEAFAYPEIIQNPNILVVTMEQLEAILKNDADQCKSTKQSDTTPQPLSVALGQLPSSKATVSPSRSPLKHHVTAAAAHKPAPSQQLPTKSTSATPTPAAAAAAPAASPAADSSMSTELNATTLALLQQMLWLPYFGQLSQEFFKTLKDPLGLQRKFMSNLLPLYNSQFGLQHLDELYKHCLKQKPTNEEPAPAPAPARATTPAKQAAAATNFNGFNNPMELAFMQKLLQQQQQLSQQQPQLTKDATQHHHHLEHKRARRDADVTSVHTPDFNSKQLPKPSVQPAAAAAATAPTVTPPAAASSVQPVEHKPRLTCKSLSNLLEPESNVVPLLNVPFDALGRGSGMHKTPHELTKEPSSGRTLRSSKASVTYNPVENVNKTQNPTLQQRKRGNMLAHEVQQQQQQQHLAEAAAAAAAAAGAGMDANSALWHPLFGSNPKQGYNSPWQWTTVTATGE